MSMETTKITTTEIQNRPPIGLLLGFGVTRGRGRRRILLLQHSPGTQGTTGPAARRAEVSSPATAPGSRAVKSLAQGFAGGASMVLTMRTAIDYPSRGGQIVRVTAASGGGPGG